MFKNSQRPVDERGRPMATSLWHRPASDAPIEARAIYGGTVGAREGASKRLAKAPHFRARWRSRPVNPFCGY